MRRPPTQDPYDAYFRGLRARLKRGIDARLNTSIRNRAPHAGPFDKLLVTYSNGMQRLIVVDVQTRNAERRKGYLKKLLKLLDKLAKKRGLRATEIQSIMSPHIITMLPWKGFPAVRNRGNSSVKRYVPPNASLLF